MQDSGAQPDSRLNPSNGGGRSPGRADDLDRTPKTGFRIPGGGSGLWSWLTLVLFFAYGTVIVRTFWDYGITYDEDWHAQYGLYIARWYASGFQDTNALNFWTLPLQGGFFDALAAIIARLSPIGKFETIHLVNACFGVVAVVGATSVARLISGSLAGFLTAAILIATPRFYGHAFANPSDIPMAALSAVALYLIVLAQHQLPRVRFKLVIALGVIIGLALAVRSGAVLLVGYLGVTTALWALARTRRWHGQVAFRAREVVLPLLLRVGAVCLIAYVVMLAWWPAALINPILQPVKGLLYSTRFGYSLPVFFDGQVISNQDVPWYYLPKWLLISLPEHFLVLSAIGIVMVGFWYWRARPGWEAVLDPRVVGMGVLIVAVLFPLTYAAVRNPPDYDGMRHFLFLLPPLAALSGIVGSSIAASWRRGKIPIFCVLGISWVVTISDMIALHPFQYIYFNRLMGGGVASAAGSYETDYWGASYKEGADWLTENYLGRDGGAERPVRVASCLYPKSTSYFLPAEGFEYIGSFDVGVKPIDPDVFLATTRWDCPEQRPGRVIHTVSRMGAPLLYVIEVERQEGVPTSNETR